MNFTTTQPCMARHYTVQMGDVSDFSDSDSRYYNYDDSKYQPEVVNSSGSMSPMFSSHLDTTFLLDADALLACPRSYPDSTSSIRESHSPQPPTPSDQAGQPSELSHELQESPMSTPQSKPEPRKKRENRYKNAPPSVLSRRRAQNRASQRAYRERKDQRIKDLEETLSEQKRRNDALSQAYSTLYAQYMSLRTAHNRMQLPAMPVYGMSTTQEDAGLAPAGGPFLEGQSEGAFLFQNMPGYTG